MPVTHPHTSTHTPLNLPTLLYQLLPQPPLQHGSTLVIATKLLAQIEQSCIARFRRWKRLLILIHAGNAVELDLWN